MNKAQRRVIVAGLLIFAGLLHTFFCEWGGLGLKKLASCDQLPPPQVVAAGFDYEFAWRRNRVIWETTIRLGETQYGVELAADSGVSKSVAIGLGIFAPIMLVFLSAFLSLATAKARVGTKPLDPTDN